MATNTENYMGNRNLKKAGVNIEWDVDQLKEYVKCSEDPIHFIKTYIKIVNIDKGLVPFELWPFQEEMIQTAINNRFVIAKMPRQVGKCDIYDTQIKIRFPAADSSLSDTKYIVSNTTIGHLYDTVNNMQNLQSRDERSNFSHLSQTPDQGASISRAISERRDSMSVSSRFTVGQNFWRQESCLSTWWKILTVLREVRRAERQKYSQESSRDSKQESEHSHVTGLLSKENRWESEGSRNSSERSTDNFQSGEMYSEIWGSGRSNPLDQTSEEVDPNTRFKTHRRKESNKSEEKSKNWKNFKSGSTNIFNFSETVSRVENSIETESFDDISLLLRYGSWKQDHRIQWRFLARKSNEIFSGHCYEVSPREICNSERSLAKRQKENFRSRTSGVPSFRNLGRRFQEESRSSHSELSKLSDLVERKFIDSVALKDLEVWTDTGWQPASAIHKTVKYVEWELVTSSHNLTCADTHIVFREDGSEVYVQDLKSGDFILTESGPEQVISVIETNRSSHMYDITVDSEDHRFYTNGILSHNTTTVAALLLWYVLFNDNFKLAILANKEKQSREILSRIQLAFEHLPKWLQQGVVEWNKGSIELENGSKIISSSTSSTAIRGDSFNLIYLDEFAFVPSNLQDEFFASVYPTISSGESSRILITSTPNGMNMFYKIWTDSEQGRNRYKRVSVHWSDVPGRTAKWREETISNTSERQFSQEFECVDGNSIITIKNRKNGKTEKIAIKNLINKLNVNF